MRNEQSGDRRESERVIDLRKPILFLLLIAVMISPSWAQEVYVYGGAVETAQSHKSSSYSWGYAYMQGIGEHAMVSFTYLNEGHLPEHHRDGYSIQFWGRTNVLDRRLSLAAGVGPYLYFDTATDRIDNGTSGRDSYNHQAWGAIVSLAATWYTESRWLFQVRGNWVGAANSFDTFSITGGIGYQLDAPPSPGPRRTATDKQGRTTNNEITLFAGESILNRAESRHNAAEAIEYRRGLGRFIDWTVGLLNEGSRVPLERYGITSQLWAVRAFFDDRLALGVGLGPYLAYDEYRSRNGSTTVNLLLGVTSSLRLSPQWAIRVTWNRVATNYDQDTDVVLGGLTYRF
jgi:hypothetical protein